MLTETGLLPTEQPTRRGSWSAEVDTVAELMVDAQPRVAYLRPGLTPLTARTLNLAAVANALDRANVDYFGVPGLDDRLSVIGVNEIDRGLVFQALKRLMTDMPGYVSTVVPPTRRGASLFTGDSQTTWTALRDARVIRAGWFRAEPTRKLMMAMEYGCEIEFWRLDEQRRLVGPRANRLVKTIAADAAPVTVPGRTFTRLAPTHRNDLPLIRTRADFAHQLTDVIDFPVDAVYTWVDGSDPEWLRKKAKITGRHYHPEAANMARFINRDELRYSLRSLHLNAPWIRNIYVVTDDQMPPWLDDSLPNINLVSHRDIFSDPSVLPCYNSFAIESQLHHIDGLAEHFLYFNDDMFLGRPVSPNAFFYSNGSSKFFLSQTRVAMGPVNPVDTPIDATVKNNRALIEAKFGKTITQCTQHVPYPLQRSVLAELEREFPNEHYATMASRFRAADNLSITYSLHHYYAYHTGRAVPGSVRYGYIQLAVPDLVDRLARVLERRDWDTFCLNDAFSTEDDVQAQSRVLLPFLESYFPVASPYELS